MAMLRSLTDQQLQQLVQEEAPYGDLSTMSLGVGDQTAQLTLAARQPLTVCGTEEVARLFELAGACTTHLSASGRHVLTGAELLTVQGRAGALLLLRRLAHQLLAMSSGVASEVARIVTELRAAGHLQPVACPPGAWPGLRSLAVKAVHSGGGIMSVGSLSDALLLSPEHRVFVDASMDDAVARLGRQHPERRLVAEVASLQEAMALAEAGAEALQLTDFTPAALHQCKLALHASRLHPMLIAAGDVHGGNAVAYADAGADMLLTSAPYAAMPSALESRLSRGVQ